MSNYDNENDNNEGYGKDESPYDKVINAMQDISDNLAEVYTPIVDGSLTVNESAITEELAGKWADARNAIWDLTEETVKEWTIETSTEDDE